MADKEVLNGNVNALMLSNRIVFNNISIDLDRVEKMVLISLVNHNNWKTGICNPSIKTIQDEWFYKSDREVIKALKSLREKNIISKQTIKRRNYYKLNIALILKDYLQNDGNPQNVGNLQNEGDNTPQNVGNDYPQNEGTNNERTMKEQLNIYSSNDEDNISYFERINKEIDDLENEINNKYDKDLVTKEKEKLKDENLGTLDLLRELKKQLDKNIKKSNKEKTYMDLTFIDDVIDKVKITKEQYDSLIDKFNKDLVHQQILSLDNYIVNGKGAKYKDHYRAINNWCIKNNKDKAKSKEEPKRRGTNLDDL
ncbi:TPA: helix-turn-helix domain-containing protein [Clostridium perfringens]|uniref:helix-turn-helix domain-containing protein n=2 Tax=Clostridium perfringens TaxID=1502 RepID=UPI0013E34725|nr:helix-turn-helix domain-containing protein [Clostridium perfringens]MCX0395092.1 helix-turn-helix domain-containing protein [Clostridium perfringens]MDB2053330.1 helix-turn-helix domain-containing protein [Clostridium perfringens]MDK0715693.1 helix-turn-helix domain-containing protein [Clostridium perfringens]MDK0718227.1 helix-turn-helix domain-containing protein [Clostridium perfringens]MDM0719939.1 helix-turn-helix domain-containing protein [Clostridium perfringens]